MFIQNLNANIHKLSTCISVYNIDICMFKPLFIKFCWTIVLSITYKIKKQTNCSPFCRHSPSNPVRTCDLWAGKCRINTPLERLSQMWRKTSNDSIIPWFPVPEVLNLHPKAKKIRKSYISYCFFYYLCNRKPKWLPLWGVLTNGWLLTFLFYILLFLI